MKETILIASASSDEHAYGPVTEILENNGHHVLLYRTDRLLSGDDHLAINFDEDAKISFEYKGVNVSSDNIGAAWYRKIANFALESAANDTAKQQMSGPKLHLRELQPVQFFTAL